MNKNLVFLKHTFLNFVFTADSGYFQIKEEMLQIIQAEKRHAMLH